MPLLSASKHCKKTLETSHSCSPLPNLRPKLVRMTKRMAIGNSMPVVNFERLYPIESGGAAGLELYKALMEDVSGVAKSKQNDSLVFDDPRISTPKTDSSMVSLLSLHRRLTALEL
jgi:hypothetical protein